MSSGRFRVCSICRTDIAFGAAYYRCSVSTCNSGKLAQYFCSLDCFTAHVPTMRHRDAWAEQETAPTDAEPAAASPATAEPKRRIVSAQAPAPAPTPPGAAGPEADLADGDVLVVVSKLKQYIRTRSGMNTSDTVMPVLSAHLRRLCNDAIRRAAEDGRKTVLDRDFPKAD